MFKSFAVCGLAAVWVTIVISHYPRCVSSAEAELISYPTSNLTHPLGRTTPAVFHCVGKGTFLLWKINGTLVPDEEEGEYERRGFTFTSQFHRENGSRTSTVTISVSTLMNNNTKMNCHATGNPGPRTSPDVFLTIAGPPLTPRPTFHIVNTTHIKLQWDKPYAIPDFDVRNYTLVTRSDNSSMTTEHAADQQYPIVHYISNGGSIPQQCVHMNFTLTAMNDVGMSDEGFTTGGFAIESSVNTISDSFSHNVSFTANFTPVLHISFTLPKVCSYEDANYTISILNDSGDTVDEFPGTAHDNDDVRQHVDVDFTGNMFMNTTYRVRVEFTSAVNSMSAEFTFNTLVVFTTTEPSTQETSAAGSSDKIPTLASAATAGFLLVVLLIMIIILLCVFTMRRRKLKLRNQAHREEIDSDEALQRATLAMIPNPIYSGSPIYDEIVDPSLLKFLKKNGSEPQSRDEGYVEISGNRAGKAFGASQLPDNDKLLSDKLATMQEDAYTVMNPVGTLSYQGHGSVNRAYSLEQRYNMSDSLAGNWNPSGSQTTTQSNGYFTDTSEPSNDQFQYEDEERYVKGL